MTQILFSTRVRGQPSLLRSLTALALCGLIGGAHAAKPSEPRKPGEPGKPGAPLFSHFVVPATPASFTTPVTPLGDGSFALLGGGPDVDAAFKWMIERAGVQPGTGGRFVIIRATGTDAYNPYIWCSNALACTSGELNPDWIGGAAMGLSSVETLIIPSRAAADDVTVNAIVNSASAAFIAGGDQSNYINFWKNSLLDATLKGLMLRRVPIGGTSAGIAVMGHFDFAALNGTVTSREAMRDPFNRFITLDPDPLTRDLRKGFIAPAALSNITLDSHVDTRDRMGRLITFVARTLAPDLLVRSTLGCPGGVLGSGTALGIGLSVETALLVEARPDGVFARRVTNTHTLPEAGDFRTVYFVRPDSGAGVTCASHKRLSISNVNIHKLTGSSAVDLGTWAQSGLIPLATAPHHQVAVFNGDLVGSPY